MGRVIISHLAPAQEDEIRFLLDLALAFERRGHVPIIWSAIYDRRFAPWYWPLNWRIKLLPEYFEHLEREAPAVLRELDADKWRARVEVLPKQEWPLPEREPLLELLAGLAGRTLDAVKPDLLLSWNTLCPHTGLAHDLCGVRGIPSWLIERAVFPQTWFVEEGGLVGRSRLAGTPAEYHISQADAERYRGLGQHYLESVSFASYERYAQAQESPAMRKLLAAPLAERRPRVALFPPDDGTLGFVPVEGEDRIATLPGYASSFEAAKALAQAHGGITVFKPHPSFLEREFDTAGLPDLHVVDYDFRRIIEWADVVATTGSGLGFVAMAMDKPLVLLGNDLLAGKGIAYEAQDPAALPDAVEAAYTRINFEARRARFQEFVGYLIGEELARPGAAPQPARTPDDVAQELVNRFLGGTPEKPVEEFWQQREMAVSPAWARKLAADTEQVLSGPARLPARVIESEQEALLNALRAREHAHVILDFDHTLILDNSTERFLKAARPQVLAFAAATTADVITASAARIGLCRHERWRDFLRLLFVIVFLPWSLPWWSLTAGRRMRRMLNAPLAEAVAAAAPERVTIISFGFRQVIQPLLRALPFQAELVCSSLGPRVLNLRKEGKVAALARTVPKDSLRQGIFVTDSGEDSPLFDYIPRCFLIEWTPYPPKAFWRLYLPMRYAVQGKYARRRYFSSQILKEDFLILLLAFEFGLWNFFALLFLFVSFYAVYELGYYDNDHKAAKKEKQPTLTQEAISFNAHRMFIKAWLWAILAGAAGVACASVTHLDRLLLGDAVALIPLAVAALMWLGVLLATRLLFNIFNLLTPRRRIFVFPFLHGLKTFSFALLVPLTPAGALLLLSQVLTQTANYLIYRFGGDTSRFNRQGYRMVFFLGVTAAAALQQLALPPFVLTLRYALILVWGGLRTLERARRKSIEFLAVDILKLAVGRLRAPRPAR